MEPTTTAAVGVSEKGNEGLQVPAVPACPVCGGYLMEVRAKLQCTRCHQICETCCGGGPRQVEQ